VRRIFLDANILFSAAWHEPNRFATIWKHPDLLLVTSSYALAEAERNVVLKRPVGVVRLAHLVSNIEINASIAVLESDYGLPEKDLPILQAAVGSSCEALLTGDKTHFGHLFGKDVAGIRVLTASELIEELNSP
jgi:predicted nucleic acid-binding protein